MYFQQFYLTCLAQASYLIGSEGEAVVVDPQRDVDLYLDEAKAQGLEIKHVIETHLHADFVSGHRELAARIGAKIYLGAAAGAKFDHVAVRDGDELAVGKLRLRFLETPGHTPESICILLTDTEVADHPTKVLTGDTLFIGDVGRPDLSPTHTPRELAGLLYDSLRDKLMTLPDDVEVYPAHGAGSLCGKNLSPERWSTIGKQRQFNYALQEMSREAFVNMLTAELPERPEYFAEDAAINRDGPALLAESAATTALSPHAAFAKLEAGAVALDTRPASLFGAGHLPGSINIGLGGQFATWAATVIGLHQSLVIVAEDDEKVEESTLRLSRVGIENVAGYLQGGVEAWEAAGLPLETTPQVSVHQLQEHRGEWQVLDVRRIGEYRASHLPGAIHQPLDTLSKALEGGALPGVDRNKPVAVHCKGGYRSSAACGLLQAHGYREVYNVVGGLDAWVASGLPVEDAVESCSTPVCA
jgi:glyoxylase-like metal-dependent hydrolase (beta-lactamase superfamily II)/rhodanese-related sulfurtransferase